MKIQFEVAMTERKIIRRKEFRAELGGISDTTFWRLSQQPEFPKKIMLSQRLVGYYSDEVDDYISSKQIGGTL